MSPTASIPDRLREWARRRPDKPAVIAARASAQGGVSPVDRRLSFAELARDMDRLALGFARAGLAAGEKTLFMVRPGLDFFAGFFALLARGAVPVLIDPGMGRARLFECVAHCAPAALAGISPAHLVTRLWPAPFRSLRFRATAGRLWPLVGGGPTFEQLRAAGAAAAAAGAVPGADAPSDPDALAAILFTTGSTGPAKGVEYTRGMLARQLELLAGALDLREDDVDCATFPGFSLYSAALGMTAVIPDMNPARPGFADPRHIESVIRHYRCTFAFGSPALWRRVTTHAVENRVTFPTLRRAMTAGAPAPEEVHEKLLAALMGPEAETFAPYGATEAMPVANLAGSEALRETFALTREGKGVCVGRPPSGVTTAVIPLTDDPIPEWSGELQLPVGEIGEIAVTGEHVTRRYHRRPDADRLAKISEKTPDGGERIWHRMGDAGYIDALGRLWFCGRKAHRVDAPDGSRHFSECCEAVMNRHPAVARSALVRCRIAEPRGAELSRGGEWPGLVVELRPGFKPAKALMDELRRWAEQHETTRKLAAIKAYPGPLPTDIRHNTKINREELTRWINASARV